MDYSYKIGKGLGDLTFKMTKNQVISLLGKPEKIIKDENDTFQVLDYIYDTLGIKITFYDFHDAEFDNLTIYSYKLFHENMNWFDLEKKTILKIVREICNKYGITPKYKYEKSDLESYTGEEYCFDGLGLSLWFEDRKLAYLNLFQPDKEINQFVKGSVPKPYIIPEPTTEMIAAEPEIAYNKTIS